MRAARIGLLLACAVGAVGVALPATARANCSPGMLDYRRGWPRDGAVGVPTNTRVVVHLHGTDAFLAWTPRLVLVPPAGPVIGLRVVEDLRSGDRRMQQRTLVLAPRRLLAPATRYTLVARNAAPPTAVPVDPTSFTTGDGPDHAAPAAVAVTAGRFVRFEMGCGPSEFVDVVVHATDDTALFVRLVVTRDAADLAAGRTSGEMILPVESGTAAFGHEMCVGNWPIRPGERWVARASVLDAAGNETAAGVVTLVASP